MILKISETLASAAWGMPLVVLLIGGGAYLFFLSRGLPLIGFVHAIKLITGKVHNKGDDKAKGQLTHFKALTNAIAATVGLGNIGGVAVAISTGGPGAVFWMWITGFVGMNTKFFECTLSVMYRGQDYRGEVQGGPMYVIEKAMNKKLLPLAYFFALFGLLGPLPLYNVNQLTDYLEVQYGFERWWVGVGCAIILAYILYGGVLRIANVTSSLVPLMCVIYIAFCLVVIVKNFEMVGPTFESIFTSAMGGGAIAGGIFGQAFKEIMITGVKRAAFSNEAGIGTAPMAHSNAKTSEPISEGLVAMVGPFIDTIIICTLTALVILVSFPDQSYTETKGVLLTLAAFERNLPGVGVHILGVCIVLFSVTTIIGASNYSEKCWNFLFRGRKFLGENTLIAFICVCVVAGSMFSLDVVVNFLDAGYGFMAFPNMIATLILAPKVVSELKKYWQKVA